MTKRRVFITAWGMSTPAGEGWDHNLDAWYAGRSHFTRITSFDATDSSVQFAGQSPDPDLSQLPQRKVQKILRRKDLQGVLMMHAARRAAGWAADVYHPERIGVYVGAASTQIGDSSSYYQLVKECMDFTHGRFDNARFGARMHELVNPLVVLQILMNNTMCYGAIDLDCRGVNANYMDFHISGLRALGEAFKSVRDGRCDVAFAGGVAGQVEPFHCAEGMVDGYLAITRGCDERTVSAMVRPYDAQRGGTILSDGVVFATLENEESARARGANLLAEVTGFGLASDGHLAFESAAEAYGLDRAMDVALKEAAISPYQLGFIVGHGDGSWQRDLAEAAAYGRLWSEAPQERAVLSAKAVFGEMCEAGSALSVALASGALQRGILPAQANFTEGDEISQNLCIPRAPNPYQGAHAMITARSFLGLSAALVLRRASAT